MTEENQEKRKDKILKLSERVRKMMKAAVLASSPLIAMPAKNSIKEEYDLTKLDYFGKLKTAPLEPDLSETPDKYEANCGQYKIIKFPKDQTKETETTEE